MFNRLRQHFTLAAIINPLPNTIAPNTLADATQVQQNFAAIVADVNANAQPISGTVNFGRFAADLGGSNVILTGIGTQLINLVNIQYDTLSEYLGGTYTASQPGTYQIEWVWTPTTSGAVQVTTYVVVNGSFPGIVSRVSNSVDDSICMQASRMYELAAGDTVRFYAQRDATPNNVSGAVYATYGSVTRIA